MKNFIQRWLDRRTTKRVEIAAEIMRVEAIAKTIAAQLIQLAEKNPYRWSGILYIDRLKFFSRYSIGFVHKLVYEALKERVGPCTLKHFSTDHNGYSVGLVLWLPGAPVAARSEGAMAS